MPTKTLSNCIICEKSCYIEDETYYDASGKAQPMRADLTGGNIRCQDCRTLYRHLEMNKDHHLFGHFLVGLLIGISLIIILMLVSRKF